MRILGLLAISFLGVSQVAHAQSSAGSSPSSQPVQGPTEGNSPGAPAARGASPGGATGAGGNAVAQSAAGHLLGDPGGVRAALAHVGVSLGLNEQSEVLGNVTGGYRRGAVYEGVTSLGLGVDTQKAFGLAGGTFNVTAYQFHGRGLTANDVPTLNALSGIEQTTRSTRLFELWYEQLLRDKTLGIRVGQQSADQEFITTEYGGLFINSGYGFPTLPADDLPSGGPEYPLATPAVRIKYVPNQSLAVLVAVFNGDPAGPGPGSPQARDASGTAFRLGDGVFAIAELQYGINQGEHAPGLPGIYKVGVWYDSQPFADQRFSATGQSLADPANTAGARPRRNDYSAYAVADQLLWKRPGTTDGGVAVFARAMGAPADRNVVDWFVQGGVTYKAPFLARPNDTVGFAVSWGHVGQNAAKFDSDTLAFTGRAIPVRRAETQLELTYQAQLTPSIQLQPDLQYVFNPGGGLPGLDVTRRVANATVLGVRANVTF